MGLRLFDMGIITSRTSSTSPTTPTIAVGSNTSCSNSTISRTLPIAIVSKINRGNPTSSQTPIIAMGSNTNSSSLTRPRTPPIAVGSNTNNNNLTRPRTPPIAMGSNGNPSLPVARPVSPDRTIDEEDLEYYRLPPSYCSFQQSSIVCHHRSAIYTTGIITELVGRGDAKSKHVPRSTVLKKPPPQPETYTNHLAILRNPKHQEWKSQPDKYLSPPLSNISPYYVKRFVETEAREDLKQGIHPGRPAFTLSKVQARELEEERDEMAEYETLKASRLEEELDRLAEETRMLEVKNRKLEEVIRRRGATNRWRTTKEAHG